MFVFTLKRSVFLVNYDLSTSQQVGEPHLITQENFNTEADPYRSSSRLINTNGKTRTQLYICQIKRNQN